MLFRFILFLVAAWFVAVLIGRIGGRHPARRDRGPVSGTRTGPPGAGWNRRTPHHPAAAPEPHEPSASIPRDQIIEARFTEVEEPPRTPPQ